MKEIGVRREWLNGWMFFVRVAFKKEVSWRNSIEKRAETHLSTCCYWLQQKRKYFIIQVHQKPSPNFNNHEEIQKTGVVRDNFQEFAESLIGGKKKCGSVKLKWNEKRPQWMNYTKKETEYNSALNQS